jgi:hypothetical protein
MVGPALRIFRIKLTDADGVERAFRFDTDQLNDLIHHLIEAGREAAAADPDRELVQITTLRDNPIRATAFGIAPAVETDGPEQARLIVRCGPLELQCSVPLDDLYEALKVLEEMTVTDPSGQGGH